MKKLIITSAIGTALTFGGVALATSQNHGKEKKSPCLHAEVLVHNPHCYSPSPSVTPSSSPTASPTPTPTPSTTPSPNVTPQASPSLQGEPSPTTPFRTLPSVGGSGKLHP